MMGMDKKRPFYKYLQIIIIMEQNKGFFIISFEAYKSKGIQSIQSGSCQRPMSKRPCMKRGFNDRLHIKMGLAYKLCHKARRK